MSNFDVNGVINRGESPVTGRLSHMLGRTFLFPNMSSLTARAPRDQRNVWMMVVKNGEASAAILPGSLVTWKTALAGTTVVLPAATAGVLICGVADWLMPSAGALAGDDFLITVLGPTKFLADANAGITEFDNLINSGSVAGCVRTGTTSGAIVGRAEATVSAGGGTTANATLPYGYFNGGNCNGP